MNSFIGSTTKYGLIFFNFICLVFGLLCIIFGALARSSANYGDVLAVGQGPANMSIIVGVCVFVICFLGCCGALKENRCMLITFGCIVFLLVIVEFAIGGFAYKYRNKLEDVSVDGFRDMIKRAEGEAGNKDLMKNLDDLQSNLKCCGAVNASDWGTPDKIPDSCYEDKKAKKIYAEGCVQAIKETLAPAMKVLSITVIIFACIQVLGILGSCCVASCIRRAQYDHV